MNEFVLLFRRDRTTPLSPQHMQDSIEYWQDWLGSIAAQDKLVSPGSRLNSEGRVVAPGDIVTDGPYTEIKETLGGFVIVKAADFNEAVRIAKGCPILRAGGNVEVRKTVAMDDNS